MAPPTISGTALELGAALVAPSDSVTWWTAGVFGSAALDAALPTDACAPEVGDVVAVVAGVDVVAPAADPPDAGDVVAVWALAAAPPAGTPPDAVAPPGAATGAGAAPVVVGVVVGWSAAGQMLA